MPGLWTYLRLPQEKRYQLAVDDWCKSFLNWAGEIGRLHRQIMGGDV